ncbi:MAG TPA: hypothetical protein VF194_19665 [Ferrovibrio sp.]|uniref:hypothetical protein n=1 Tax=Ferrovibrio sp. TaxID=1917215 RepID=UPI002ED0AA02
MSVLTPSAPQPPFDVNVKSHVAAGSSFFSSASVSTSAVQAVSPASNTNGILLVAIRIVSGGATAMLFRGTSAPSSWNDISKALVAIANSAGVVFFQDLVIPSGQGLWFIGSGAVNYCNVEYEFL